MTVSAKELWLSAIAMQPLERIPFWPKLWSEYPGMQKAPFCDMDLPALHQWIGSDYHHMPDVPTCVKHTYTTCDSKEEKHADLVVTTYSTPHGEMRYANQFDRDSQSWHPVEHPVKNPDDIRLMTEFYNDILVELDPKGLAEAELQSKTLGNDGLLSACCGTSPLMLWVEFLAGIENAHFLLADYTKEVEDLFQAIHRVVMDTTRLNAQHHPADILYFNENTSTTLISPAQYRKYCFAHISAYADIIKRSDKLVFLHMCGHLKALLPDLAKLNVDAFEAFTSPSLANTTLLDGRTACPQKCLIGGTNAVLWTQPESAIIAAIKKDLDELPHHRGIVITSGGAMPPQVEPPKIQAVCEWLKTYPVNMQRET